MHIIKKVVPRVLILILFILALNRVTRYAYESPESNTPFTMQDERQVKGTVDTIAIGTSLVHLGVDPEILDEELECTSFNLGSSAQPIAGSYYLLKDQVLNNPIKRVFLGFNTVGLNLKREESDKVPSKLGIFDRIMSPLVRAEFVLDLVEFPYYEKFFFYPTRIKKFSNLKAVKENIAYKRSEAYKAQISPEGVLNSYHTMGHETTDVSKYLEGEQPKMPGKAKWDREDIEAENIEYMRKIGEYCQKKGVECNIVIMPMAEPCAKKQGDLTDMDQFFQEICDEVGANLYSFNYTSCENVYDFLPNECFYDGKHLNKKGAEAFTKLLAEEYKKRH